MQARINIDAAPSGDIPTALPNPQALTFTGGATGTYDGSSAKTINIPEPLLSGDTSTITPTQVLHAIGEGRDVAIEHTHAYYGLLAFTSFIVAGDLEVLASSSVILLNGQAAVCQLLGNIANNTWECTVSQVVQTSEMPTALPNPNALTFSGAVSGTYDGSSAKTIDIPTIAGEKGVGISKITQSYAAYIDDEPNVITISLTDNTAYTFEVQNGSKGTVGANGLDGADGADGADGYTPVKGVDYWTDTDRASIVSDVIAILGEGSRVYATVDDSNNISLSGDLEDGQYTLKYNNSNGSTTTIGTLTISSGPSYTNLVPTAKTHTDISTVFNGTGYMDGKYASSSSPYYGTDAATVCTGVFEAAGDDVFYIKGITLDASANSHCRVGIGQAHATNGGIAASSVKEVNQMSTYATLETLGDQYYKLTILASYISANLTRQPYIWFSGIGTGANLIVTRNEPIE